MAIDLLKAMSQSEQERMRADSRERFLRDKATLHESERMKGLVEGEEIGLRKGEEQGIKKKWLTCKKRVKTQNPSLNPQISPLKGSNRS